MNTKASATKEKPTIHFSLEDIKLVGRLINNMSFVGSQLLVIRQPELYKRARANLKTIQRDFGEFVSRLDALGSQANDVCEGRLLEDRVGRLLEDIERTPTDATGILTLANRCFLAVAFLSHCLVVGASAPSPDPVPAERPIAAPMHH
jgi:hypothetical protein